ncbi:MAG: SIR2 family protein [Terracidiphilus sp.]
MNEPYSTDVLAESLRKGTLVLFLGAGVSVGASLPRWKELIESMRGELSLPKDGLGPSADSLQAAADDVQRKYFEKYPENDKKGFAEFVGRCLYKGVKLDEGLVTDPGLVALGALMSGSRRGSVNRVVTLNFDCVLEWYISLYGLVPHVVTQLPADEGAEDVRIYHPHGFLPHPDFDAESGNFVILGLKSINERLGDISDDWSAFLRHILTSGMVLFVGLSETSFRDRAIGPWLEHAAKKNEKRNPTLPTGFWVLKLEDDRTEADILKIKEEFLASRVVPLIETSEEAITRLLLRICQKAAQLVSVSR